MPYYSFYEGNWYLPRFWEFSKKILFRFCTVWSKIARVFERFSSISADGFTKDISVGFSCLRINWFCTIFGRKLSFFGVGLGFQDVYGFSHYYRAVRFTQFLLLQRFLWKIPVFVGFWRFSSHETCWRHDIWKVNLET